MQLLDRIPFQGSIIDAPPVRLEYDEVVIPPEVDFTFIGTVHDGTAGVPDYMEDMLADADVLCQELYGWEPKGAKLLQRLAKGDYKARQKIQEEDAMNARPDDIAGLAGQAVYDKVFHKALYNSGVHVVQTDYPLTHPACSMDVYDRAFERFTNGDFSESTLSVIAARDKFMLRAVCAALPKVREQNPRLAAKSPLRVIMPAGFGHLAVPAALEAAADDQDIDSFMVRSLFEPSVPLAAIESQAAHTGPAPYRNVDLIYQKWLRTPTQS